MPMPKATVATTTSQRSFGEGVLGAAALVLRQAGVVGDGLDAACAAEPRQLVHVLLRGGSR